MVSMTDQHTKRLQNALQPSVHIKGFRIASLYIENQSCALLQRPKLLGLLDDAVIGELNLISKCQCLRKR